MQVKLDTKTVQVDKLKLTKFAEVLSILETIPEILSELTGKSNDEIFNLLPKLIAKALPEVIQLLGLATSLTPDEVESLGLDEAVELLKAVFEVNKIGRVAENLKNLFKNSASPTGSLVSSISALPSMAGAENKSSIATPAKSTI